MHAFRCHWLSPSLDPQTWRADRSSWNYRETTGRDLPQWCHYAPVVTPLVLTLDLCPVTAYATYGSNETLTVSRTIHLSRTRRRLQTAARNGKRGTGHVFLFIA